MFSKWEAESGLALKAVSAVTDSLVMRPERLILSCKSSQRDIVTDLDVEIEQQIRAILKTSEYPILGEETHFKEGSLGPPKPPYWCVDPIDGTVNFVNGLPTYAVSVGLYNGDFVAGAISVPAFKELYFTLGDSSHLNGKRLMVSDCPLKSALVVECFSGHSDTPENLRKRQYNLFADINDSSRGCLRLGSAATSIAYVAAGRIQAVCGFRLELWDVAAGIALAERSGCKALYAIEPNSTKINFIVGAPSAVDEIHELCIKNEVMHFEKKTNYVRLLK